MLERSAPPIPRIPEKALIFLEEMVSLMRGVILFGMKCQQFITYALAQHRSRQHDHAGEIQRDNE